MPSPIGRAKIISWIIGAAALWAVALLLIFQHLMFSDPMGRFEAQRANLNSALRGVIIQLGIRPDSRSVQESNELQGDNSNSWNALNWRIRLPEGFDIPHARARLTAAITESNARPMVRWSPEDAELPLVVEAYIGERLSHRLLFVPPQPEKPLYSLDAQAFLGTRWQLLSGQQLELDSHLYSELSAMELNGPPLLIREFWQSPLQDDAIGSKIPHWVISVQNGLPPSEAVEALRGRIELGEMDGDYSYFGESLAVDVSLNGEVSHRLIFTDTPEGRGLSLKKINGERNVLLTPPRVAIIIDDIGFDSEMARRLMDIEGLKLTLSIIPYQAFSTEIAVRAHQRGIETMVHMPMEPNDYPANNPGRGAILVNLEDDVLAARAEAYLGAVPHASGVNNHMGSRAMADGRVVNLVLSSIAKRNLYFIDSRTSAQTLGFETARILNIPAAERAVFLDEIDNSDVNYRLEMLRKLIRLAKERGVAVGIGHPSEETLEALRIAAREFLEAGIEVVFASEIVS